MLAARRILGFSPITFAPFDVRFYVRLALIVLAWKQASQDYGNLAYLSIREPLHHHELGFVQDLALWLNRTLLATELNVLIVQLVGIVCCFVAILRPSRLSIALAFVTVSLIEFPSFLWRLQNWDIDLPLAVMLMVVLMPCNLKQALSTSRQPSHDATIAGGVLAVYMALMYCLAGLSKVILSGTWFADVSLGNNWRTQMLDLAEYNTASNWLGEQASGFFITF